MYIAIHILAHSLYIIQQGVEQIRKCINKNKNNPHNRAGFFEAVVFSSDQTDQTKKKGGAGQGGARGRGGAAARGHSRGVFRAHPVETPGNYSLQVLILPFLFLFECLLIQYVIRLSCIALCHEASSF